MRKLLAAFIAVALVGALAPIAARALAAREPAQLQAALAEELASVSDDAELVVLVHGTSRAAAVDAVADAGLEQLLVLESIGVPAAVGTAAEVRELAADPSVTYIERNASIELYADTAHQATRADVAHQLTFDTNCQTTCTKVGPFDGAGRSIAIVDGGIDGTHPMFQRADGTSKVVRNFKVVCHDFVCPLDGGSDAAMVDVTGLGNDSDTPSVGGHGTHVASIAAGSRVETADGRKLAGTAPGADIVGFSVGQGLNILAADVALDWIARNHAKPCEGCAPITVVNNSYGPAGGGTFDPKSATALITDKLLDANVVMVWANGNGDAANDGGDGSDNRSNPEGQNPRLGVLSVANYSDNDTGARDGSLNSSSSRGNATDPRTWPDVSAPGTDITAACRPYLAICGGALNSADPNYGTIGGTSMAAPHVAGIVALLQQAKPGITPADIELALENTAYKFQFGAPYFLETRTGNPSSSTSFDKGHGLVDAAAALGAAVWAPTPAAPAAACTSPIVKDESGDADKAEVVVTVDGLPNEPQLDVVGADFAWDTAAGALSATVTVEDLGEKNPTGTPELVYEVRFSYGGVDHFFSASREGTTESAYFGGPGTPVRARLAEASVEFDAAADTITVTLTNAALADTTVKPFATGDVLSGVLVLAQRTAGIPRNPVLTAASDASRENGGPGIPRGLLITADEAATGCAYTLGGAGSAPAPQPFPEPAPQPGGGVNATLHDGESFVTEATTKEDTAAYTCTGPGDPKCFTYRVEVLPAGESTINVWLNASLDAAVLDDWDIYVYDAAGVNVDRGFLGIVPTSGMPQTVTEGPFGAYVDVDGPGIYTIVLQPYSALADATMELHADLIAAA